MFKKLFKKEVDSDFAGLESGLLRDMRFLTIEGGFSMIMGTLIGGAFLTGYALSMGADSFIIGILAALPLLANIVQIIGSYLINKMGDTKKVCIIYVILHRILWLLIILSPFLLLNVNLFDLRIWVFVGMMGVASIFASISGLSWTSWMADLIPQQIRGRFFARRNMVAQIAGMITAILAGLFLDYWQSLSTDTVFRSYAFVFLFSIGTIAGLFSIILLRKTRRASRAILSKANFLSQLKKPILHLNFRRFIIFTSLWGLAVSLVGPFFNVYMINHLKIPFSFITLFGVVSGLAAIIGIRLWGKFIDHYGPKPLLIMCSIGASIIPSLWILASAENYTIIWVINIISGFCWSGIGLASGNMMMNLAPANDNAVYFAIFAAITGISGAMGPIAGGYLGKLYLNITVFSLSGLKLLFVTSSLLRLTSLLTLNCVQVRENATIGEIFAKFNNWQRYLPIYNLSRFSVFNINYRGNMLFTMSRGMVRIKSRLEELINRDNKEFREETKEDQHTF